MSRWLSPCGMWSELLHSFYRMPITLRVGGRLFSTWVRWYRAPVGAKQFPFPSFLYSRVWTQEHQEDGSELGERGFPRVWTRGQNPGFQGQNYIGQPEWFMTGELPGYVLTDPMPDVPAWCCTPPARTDGGTIIRGQAVGANFPPSTAGGTLVLGGAAVGADYPPSTGGGTLVLGGAAVGADYPPSTGGGGLVVSGAAVATMASGPPAGYASYSLLLEEVTGCTECPDGAAAEWEFTLSGITNGTCSDCSILNRTWRVTYDSACQWNSETFSLCGHTQRWQMTIVSGQMVLALSFTPFNYQQPAGSVRCLAPNTLTVVVGSATCGYPATVTLSPV